MRQKHNADYPAGGVGLAKDRARSPDQSRRADSVVVSADSHINITKDVFFERFPEHLKEKAPRILFNEKRNVYEFWMNGQSFHDALSPQHTSIEDTPGMRSLTGRMKALDAEGVDKEIAFPQYLQFAFTWPDLELREWTFRIYNQYIAELQAEQPDRFFPVAIPNYWDIEKGPESIQEIKKLGLKTFMLPTSPGKRADGSDILYQDPEFDPFWQAVVETELPVCFHVGESVDMRGKNGYAASVLSFFGSTAFRLMFGRLTFGGVFDRYPSLQVLFAEANINWVPGTLQDAEMVYNTHLQLCEEKPAHRPRYYWDKHCYASFMWDPAGLSMINRIGPDRIMWSADYPHHESTTGYTEEVMDQIASAASTPQEAEMIMGGTARRVFSL